MSTEEDIRETKPEDFAVYSAMYGPFDCDAACTLANAKCDIVFTLEGAFGQNDAHSDWELFFEGDSMSNNWIGKVFLNPPFSELYIWIEKCWEQMLSNSKVESITCTIPNTRSEQPFWQELIEPYRDHKEPLKDGIRLITDNQPVRKKFYADNAPILDKHGREGAARFGITILHWSRE